MGFSQRLLVGLSVTPLLFGAVDKRHVTYLMQSKEFISSIDLYRDHQKTLGRHDFEVLEKMAQILLEEGARSSDPEIQMISLFGASLGSYSSVEMLTSCVHSSAPQVQQAAMQMMGQIQDDRCDALLMEMLSSNLLGARIEALYLLAARKHRQAAGQIEALMQKLPPDFRAFFPEFFALIGTVDAMGVLKRLIDDPNLLVRLSSILSAAHYGRDDLLPQIRAAMTHLNIAEQEACAFALGTLKDSKALPQLKRLKLCPTPNVKLAALNSLYLLGDTEAEIAIAQLAKESNLFAITLLAQMPGHNDLLASLLTNEDIHVRINAAIALLQKKDIRCLPGLSEILLRDTKDLGFQPYFSLGNSLQAWKAIPCLKQKSKDNPVDIVALTLQFKEMVLRECLELPEKEFLQIAQALFETRQNDLVPLTISLLENLQTPGAIALLKQHSQKAGSPLIRTYCTLALFRLKVDGPYEALLHDWMGQQKEAQLIRFRPMVTQRQWLRESPFELTPEENSRLLIETYAALADRHDEKCLDRLLDAIKEGNPKNRFAMAGLLLRAIQ